MLKELNNQEFKYLSIKEKEIYLTEVFEKLIDRINQVYIAGTLSFMAESEKYLYRVYQDTEEILNSVWNDCLEEEEDLDEFMANYEQYYNQILAGIKRYKQLKKRSIIKIQKRPIIKIM